MRFIVIVPLLVAFGCEHKSQKDEPPAPKPSTPEPAKPPAEPPAEPVAKEPVKPPTPPPASDDDVRPPTKDDLAAYTKDIDPQRTGKLVATVETSMGALHCELYGDKAPMTVANFVGLATGKKAWKNPKTGNVEKATPFFDGITFHRVIPGFMIQGGDPLGIGRGGPGYRFDDEFVDDLEMSPGTLAMANAGAGTNGSQFFIMEGARPDLVHKHTIFGKCKELDLVQKITHVPVLCSSPQMAQQGQRCPDDKADRPETPVTINHVTFSREK